VTPPDVPKARVRVPWFALVGTPVAIVGFIVVLSIAARLTRDRGGPVPQDVVVVDAGEPDGVTDAGSALALSVDAGAVDAGPALTDDAGALVDAGPEPSISPDLVARALLPTLQACLQGALRYDPSLGGRVQLRVVVERGSPVDVVVKGVGVPLFVSCVEQRGRSALVAGAPEQPVTIDARYLLDGVRAEVRVESATTAP
jgi:hypothetical protein